MKKIYSHTIVPQQSSEDNSKLSVCALLIRSEIAFDINFFTYKTARITFAEVKNEDRKEVVIPKDNEDWLDRHITSAISKIRKRISFCCPRQSRMVSDEILESPHQFPIIISIDREWDAEPQVLCDTIHDYVVKQCLADWAEYALPQQSEKLKADADYLLEEIHDIACSYTFPTVKDPFNP